MRIGTLVYRAYNPRKVGKVVGTWIGAACSMPHRLVKWVDGSTEHIASHELRDLQALVDKTRKTLKAHEKRLQEAKQI
jgi:hypothetical protein